WFVDRGAAGDAAFNGLVGGQELLAASGSAASGRMDLLTVVEHELGHVLGLSDLDPQATPHDLLTTTLAPGVRRLPTPLPGAAVETPAQPAAQAPASGPVVALAAGKDEPSAVTLSTAVSDVSKPTLDGSPAVAEEAAG